MLNVIRIIGKAAIFVCALWTLTLLSLFFHEFGHALGYMLATGDRKWHIEIGQGKKILDTKALTVKLFVIDGYFTPLEDKSVSAAQQVLALRFGGSPPSPEIFASGMVRALVLIVLVINMLILLWSVIPANGFFRNMEDVGTDVMQIIKALKRRRE